MQRNGMFVGGQFSLSMCTTDKISKVYQQKYQKKQVFECENGKISKLTRSARSDT